MRKYVMLALLGATLAVPGFSATAFQTSGGSGYTNGSWVFGFNFTPQTNIDVTALGYWDQNGDGFLSSHQVGIYNNTTQALLTSATVLSTDLLIDQFRYQNVSPVTLLAGQSYRLVGVSQNDLYTIDASQTVDPAITFTSWTYNSGTSLAYVASGFNDGPYFGPNFTFNDSPTEAPEPSTLVLLGAGLIAVGGRRWMSRTNR